MMSTQIAAYGEILEEWQYDRYLFKRSLMVKILYLMEGCKGFVSDLKEEKICLLRGCSTSPDKFFLLRARVPHFLLTIIFSFTNRKMVVFLN